MRIFGSIKPQSESNFPFLYIIRLQIYWSLETPSSTRVGDWHMCLGTFLCEIRFRTNFIWSFFWCTAYFWLTEPQSGFPISVHYKILNILTFVAPGSTHGGDRQMRSWTSSYEIQFQITLLEVFFNAMRIFGSGESKVNPISHFCTL